MKLKDLKDGDVFRFTPTKWYEWTVCEDRIKSGYNNLPKSPSDNLEVILMKKTFDLITALTKMKNGIKCRHKSWKKNEYGHFKNKKYFRYLNGYENDGYLTEIDSLEENEWEEFVAPLIEEVKISDEYTAVVTPTGIKVGCTEFSFEKLEELNKAAKKVQNE